MPKTQKPSGTISLYEAAKLTGYHQDYLGQLCRAGKIAALKVGRNWYTTEQAVLRYFRLDEVIPGQEQELEIEMEPEDNLTRPKVDGLPIILQEPGDMTAPVMTAPIHGGWAVESFAPDIEHSSRTDKHNRKALRQSHLQGVLVASAGVAIGLLVASTLLVYSNLFFGDPVQTAVRHYDSDPRLFRSESVAGAVDAPKLEGIIEAPPNLLPNQ